MRILSSLLMLVAWSWLLPAQEAIKWQTPPDPLPQLIDAPRTPSVQLSPDGEWLLVRHYQNHPTIADLAQPELRLAGLRINPRTNGPSRATAFVDLGLVPVQSGEARPVEGLPADARITEMRWSPDGQRLAFLHTARDGIELWVLDLAAARCRRLTGPIVNDVLGKAFDWHADSRTLLVKTVPADRGAPPRAPEVPEGPIVRSSEEGGKAPARTYQDLLKSPYDEDLFEYYATAELTMVDALTGNAKPLGIRGIVSDFDYSPDGKYLLVEAIHRPFSWLVPWYRFAHTVRLYDSKGQEVRTLADLPAAEQLPKGFMAVPVGPRSFQWRADAPATLFWVEAMDGGDPKRQTDVRDRLYYLEAPFKGQPQRALDMALRFRGIQWGGPDLMLVHTRWWNTRREQTLAWAPARPDEAPRLLWDRSYEDRYTDPGDFLTRPNQWGRPVLVRDAPGNLFLAGLGASPEGNKPFLDRYDPITGEKQRLWQSEAPWYERVIDMVDVRGGAFLTLRESTNVPPNYFVRVWKNDTLIQRTFFPNPYTALEGVTKEFIRFEREDGVGLTGTLYLPKGYDKEKDGPLPVFMWAYPREYKDADAASQVTGSPYSFVRVSPSSPVLWVTRGYAVFYNVSMPVIGEGDEEPNETFVEQLQMNAAAAVKVLADMGVGDPQRVAIGGHSYGAFMTANLLAHTDLFAAGIARSGAYNRTLTPFGFQSEERTWWEAPETYYKMSPFNFAHQIKEPLLLIHGMADNNSGTYPMQSERMFAALKGHGAIARLVMLPHESHGYRARESLMHVAWETDRWLEKYVKNRKVERPKETPTANDRN